MGCGASTDARGHLYNVGGAPPAPRELLQLSAGERGGGGGGNGGGGESPNHFSALGPTASALGPPLPQRGVHLQVLVDLLAALQADEGGRPLGEVEALSTADVVERWIRPQLEREGALFYAQLVPPAQAAEAQVLVAHSPAAPLKQLVENLQAQLDWDADPARAGATAVWLDFLALEPGGELQAAELDLVVTRAAATVLVLDDRGRALNDLRCLYAVWRTLLAHGTEALHLSPPPGFKLSQLKPAAVQSAAGVSSAERRALLSAMLGADNLDNRPVIIDCNHRLTDAVLSRATVGGTVGERCVAEIQKGDMLRMWGRLPEAHAAFAAALVLLKGNAPEEEPQTYARHELAILTRVGAVLVERGLLADATAAYRALRGKEVVAHGADSAAAATAACRLAQVLTDSGQAGAVEAEALLEEARRVFAALREAGQPHADESLALTVAAKLRGAARDHAGAEALHAEALARCTALRGAVHADTAAAMAALAQSKRRCGLHAEALELMTRALEVRTETLGAAHPAVAASLDEIAALHTERGDWADAVAPRRRCIDIQEAVYGLSHPKLGLSFANMALLMKNTGKAARAESYYRRCLALFEAVDGRDSLRVASVLNNLAELLRTQEKHAEARPLLERAVALFERHHGADHPSVATALTNLAVLSRCQADHAGAEALYRRALAIRESALGPSHPTVAALLNNLAVLREHQGELAEAEALHRRALAAREATLGPDHHDVAGSINNLAVLLKRRGGAAHLEEAAGLYRRALGIFERSHTGAGEHAEGAAGCLNNLASVLREQGNLADAIPLFQRSLQIREATLGTEHPDVETSLNNLAGIMQDQGLWNEVVPLLKRQLAILDLTVGVAAPKTQKVYTKLVTVHVDLGQVKEAHALLKKVLKYTSSADPGSTEQVLPVRKALVALMLSQRLLELAERTVRAWLAADRAHFDDASRVLIEDMSLLAQVLYHCTKKEEASRMLQAAMNAAKRSHGAEHPLVADHLTTLGEWRLTEDRLRDAEMFLTHALQLNEAAFARSANQAAGRAAAGGATTTGAHLAVTRSLSLLSTVYQRQDRAREAQPLLARCLAMQGELHGNDHPDTAATRKRLQECSAAAEESFMVSSGNLETITA